MMTESYNIAVLGLWHLGVVTAACCASAGFNTTGVDDDDKLISDLNNAKAPLFEPGLDQLITDGVNSNLLSFNQNYQSLMDADIVWVCYDTPVDDNDNANVDFIFQKIVSASKFMKPGAVILISSQIPLGTSQRLRKAINNNELSIAVSPENLRLGKAIDSFKNPGRIVVGVENCVCQEKLELLMNALCDQIIWMDLPSAELAKHAINGFLAMSIAYINELATIGERFGANAYEVEMALKSETRIGPKAYVRPGEAFAGGTLARDLNYIVDLGNAVNFDAKIISAILESNQSHLLWAYHAILHLAKTKGLDASDLQIAMLGIAYKPGTSTLRRSNAINVATKLVDQGFIVKAHDIEVKSLDTYANERLTLVDTMEEAIRDAHIILIMTPWDQYKQIQVDFVRSMMKETVSSHTSDLIVVDQQRIAPQFEGQTGFMYVSFGRG